MHKFYSLNKNSLSSISNKKLWFSTNFQFNDPFELSNSYYFSKSPTYEQCVSIVCESGKLDGYTDSAINNTLTKLGAFDCDVKFIDNVKGFFINYAELKKEKHLNSMGMLSLVQGDNAVHNKMMWSHYADGLRGFCVEFDTEILTESLNKLNESSTAIFKSDVRYRNEPPLVDLYKLTQLEHSRIEAGRELISIATQKHTDWKYENEVRFYSEKNGLHSFSKQSLRRVIIGSKMHNDDQVLLKSIISSVYGDVLIQVADIKKGCYELELFRI